jgi:4-amino-4-deoxy-L-arabinose transferase-like glycosyltransferase
MFKTLSRPNILRTAAILVLFALGLGIRLVDFFDPPLDAAYRQLNSAIIARGMYYQMNPAADPQLRDKAVALWHTADSFEPPIFERLVAVTYLLTGGERIWIPRLYVIAFWLSGGLALFLLAQQLGGFGGGLTALAFYLFVPLGVLYSRRFMPDPFMVMWMLWAAWALYRWEEKRDWQSALLAGILCGVAVLVKIFSVFVIAAMSVAMVAGLGQFKANLRDRKMWVMAAVMITIPGVYYLLGIGGRAAGYFAFWNVSFAYLLAQPWFYVRWMELIQAQIGLIVTLAGLAGVLILPRKGRALLLGFWAGYVLFGLFYPWQIHTHDYYSLMLIPLVALSLAGLGGQFFDRLTQQPRLWQVVFAGVALLALFYPAWETRMTMAMNDQRANWRAWEKIGAALPTDGEIVALTEDYGTRVAYFGWQRVNTWLMPAEVALTDARGGNVGSFDERFSQAVAGKAYFLVTQFSELEAEPDLKSTLYDHYPIYAEGDGYLIFDLRGQK